MSKLIKNNLLKDGIDRRGFLECMGWAGTGLVWGMAGGVASSKLFGQDRGGAAASFTFVQISDSHIGFPNKNANPDVAGTLKEAIAKIHALPSQPDLIIHTGDLTHSSKPDEFDTVDQIIKTAGAQCFYAPGEHDVVGGRGKEYLARFGKETKGNGWYSFDHKGVHFIGLANVLDFKNGLGNLGAEQLAWLEEDLKSRSSGTPIVMFAHVPLWTVYEKWGWGTADGMQALALVKRFGSVTVLNGHIHQTMQKVEGYLQFHTATSTAFPQPKPGTASGPGPMIVPADQLRSTLGLSRIDFVKSNAPLAVVDQSL
jgi:Icc protein